MVSLFSWSPSSPTPIVFHQLLWICTREKTSKLSQMCGYHQCKMSFHLGKVLLYSYAVCCWFTSCCFPVLFLVIFWVHLMWMGVKHAVYCVDWMKLGKHRRNPFFLSSVLHFCTNKKGCHSQKKWVRFFKQNPIRLKCVLISMCAGIVKHIRKLRYSSLV